MKYEINDELMQEVIGLLAKYALEGDDSAYNLRRALIAIKQEKSDE